MISPRITLSTAARVLRQLRHDPRTIGLMVVVPSMLLVLLKNVFAGQPAVFDRVGPILLAVFPFTAMFLVTSVGMLRERTTGTLERLLTTPLNKLDLLLGYGIAFAVAATIQSAVAAAIAYGVLGLDTRGSHEVIAGLAILDASLGMALGLLVSAFASSEFQAVQFMPVIVMPQALLCGLVTPRERMADLLRIASDFMPLSYAVQAINQVNSHGSPTGLMWRDAGLIAVGTILAVAAGAATLRRQSA